LQKRASGESHENSLSGTASLRQLDSSACWKNLADEAEKRDDYK
jgi:hypothetical protein